MHKFTSRAMLRGWLALAGLLEGAILLVTLALCLLTGTLTALSFSGTLAIVGLAACGLALFAGVGGDTEMQCAGMIQKTSVGASMSEDGNAAIRPLSDMPGSLLILSLGVFAGVANVALAAGVLFLAR